MGSIDCGAETPAVSNWVRTSGRPDRSIYWSTCEQSVGSGRSDQEATEVIECSHRPRVDRSFCGCFIYAWIYWDGWCINAWTGRAVWNREPGVVAPSLDNCVRDDGSRRGWIEYVNVRWWDLLQQRIDPSWLPENPILSRTFLHARWTCSFLAQLIDFDCCSRASAHFLSWYPRKDKPIGF